MKALMFLKKYQNEIQAGIPHSIEIADFIEELETLQDRKCTNCKHCDQVKEGFLIHCSYFEQYMPIEIGKCDMWEKKR